MNILSPLDTVEEVEPLLQAGAQEFYCGLLEERWYRKYPVISINRRPAGKGHFRTFRELEKAVIRSRRNNVPVFFTVNEHYYTNEQLPLVRDYVQRAVDAGVSAVIISDYGLLLSLPDVFEQTEIHISTGGTVFNWRAASFYGELGATRVTLPRHLSLKEMAKLVKRIPSSKETTAFIFNSRCINVDGFCTFQHGLSGKQTPLFYRNACMLPYQIVPHPLNRNGMADATQLETALLNRQRVWETVHLDDHPCGACALYELQRMNLTSVKIVGRGNSTERKTTDVTFFNTLLEHLRRNHPGKSDFRCYAKSLYKQVYRRPCRSYMCHYPSVMK